MNRAQVLTPLGFGCYEYKADQSPKVCALALELDRWHTAYPAYVAVTPRPRTGRPALGPGEAPAEKPLADRVLETLREASRKGLRLRSAEICERVHASRKAKRVVKALHFLCEHGLVLREGNNRTAVYFSLTGSSS